MTRTLRLTLAYDGTDLSGWQSQPDRPTVQGLLMQSCERILGERVKVVGASRTDAGVHALRQVASLAIASPMAPAALGRALNALLPATIRVLEAREAPPGFDARRWARGKRYCYLIDRGRPADPFLRRYAWHAPYVLEAEAMARPNTSSCFRGDTPRSRNTSRSTAKSVTSTSLAVPRWSSGDSGSSTHRSSSSYSCASSCEDSGSSSDLLSSHTIRGTATTCFVPTSPLKEGCRDAPNCRSAFDDCEDGSSSNDRPDRPDDGTFRGEAGAPLDDAIAPAPFCWTGVEFNHEKRSSGSPDIFFKIKRKSKEKEEKKRRRRKRKKKEEKNVQISRIKKSDSTKPILLLESTQMKRWGERGGEKERGREEEGEVVQKRE